MLSSPPLHLSVTFQCNWGRAGHPHYLHRKAKVWRISRSPSFSESTQKLQSGSSDSSQSVCPPQQSMTCPVKTSVWLSGLGEALWKRHNISCFK